MLLGLPWAAGAQTLGGIQAEAFIGRTLDASLPVAFEDGARPCVGAEVSYGDSKLPADQVRATVVGTGAAQRVRVETSMPIDEPVVTVAVRAGCNNTLTRSYTLLPDSPSRPLLADARPQSGGMMSVALAAQAAGAPPLLMKAKPAARAGEAPALQPRRSVVKLRQPAAGAARLRLDTWEPDPQALLRVSATLSPTQEGAGRATAAALWQALNAGPEQLLRTQSTLQQLETELAQLRQAAGQTHNDVLALQRELDAPQPLAIAGRSLQLLALLLALGAGTLGILWWRARQGNAGEWTGVPVDVAFDEAPPPAQVQRAAPAPVEPVLQPQVVRAPVAVPVPPAARPVLQQASATMLRVETLAATFEEVDFLASLGLWNDAMDILKSYLEDSAAPAPLAYYELMRLCAHVDDAASLVAVRKRYAQVFGVDAPRFEQINAPLGIESYPELAARLTGGWGTADALDFIELALFTVAPPGKAFSLQAGRDLLFLHDLAMAELREGGGSEAHEGHAIAPWADDARPAQHELPDASSGHHFALDLDLDAGAGEDELRHSQPTPLELEQVPRRPEPRAALEPPESGPVSLAFQEDAFDAAVASERMRRK